MKYKIYIKSHCEYPDYEDECEATDKVEAATIFMRRLNQNGEIWNWLDLMDYIEEDLTND